MDAQNKSAHYTSLLCQSRIIKIKVMQFIKVLVLFYCTIQAKVITDVSEPWLQEYKINPKISRNKHLQGARHRLRQAMVRGQTITLTELLNLVEYGQMAVAYYPWKLSSGRRFGPKIRGRPRSGTMDEFREMQKLVGTYDQRSEKDGTAATG